MLSSALLINSFNITPIGQKYHGNGIFFSKTELIHLVIMINCATTLKFNRNIKKQDEKRSFKINKLRLHVYIISISKQIYSNRKNVTSNCYHNIICHASTIPPY